MLYSFYCNDVLIQVLLTYSVFIIRFVYELLINGLVISIKTSVLVIEV